MITTDARIRFRPITPEDLPFLAALYASTRQEELAQTGWSEADKESFLALQFEAQHRHYQTHFPDAAFELILLEGKPIGRRYLDRRGDEFRLIDIALLPEQRNRGLGGALLRDLLAEAQAAEKPVRIHVEPFNPALRLYRRLGFELLEDKGVHLFMEWRPQVGRNGAA
jgi:ribosomal protein S18 acetylase RimI-like enzyme